MNDAWATLTNRITIFNPKILLVLVDGIVNRGETLLALPLSRKLHIPCISPVERERVERADDDSYIDYSMTGGKTPDTLSRTVRPTQHHHAMRILDSILFVRL
jgi:hypothetical protein